MPQIHSGMAHAIDKYIVDRCFKLYYPEHEVASIDIPILREGLVAVEDPEIGGALRVMLDHAAVIEVSVVRRLCNNAGAGVQSLALYSKHRQD